jgi:hypothetical protein
MLIKVAKRNIRIKERSILKGAFIIKVFCLIDKLTTIKESFKGYYYHNNNIDFINSLILYYNREVYSSTKSRLKDI